MCLEWSLTIPTWCCGGRRPPLRMDAQNPLNPFDSTQPTNPFNPLNPLLNFTQPNHLCASVQSVGEFLSRRFCGFCVFRGRLLLWRAAWPRQECRSLLQVQSVGEHQNMDSSVSDVNSSSAFMPMIELPFELSLGLHTAIE